MRSRVECVGTVKVPLPPEEALSLFTPEGERAWVDGWAPDYPGGEPGELERGLVFTVGKEGGASVWTVTRFDPVLGGASYAYVLPGHRAVLIDVDVAAAAEGGGSVATVTYRMTALTAAGDAFLEDFQKGYSDFLDGWEADIRRYLASSEHPDLEA